MNNKINFALEISLSEPSEQVYAVVEEAIGVIKASGVKGKVCPSETERVKH